MPLPSVRPDLVVSPRPNGDGVLVYDPNTDTGHVLEGAAAAVFSSCDGTADRDALAERVAAKTRSIVDRSIIDNALQQLDAAGLLDTNRAMSRRVLIGGLIAGAAAVAISPLVTSVTKPAAAAEFFPSPTSPTVLPALAATTAGTPVQIPLSSTGLDSAVAVYWNVTQPANGVVTITNTADEGVNTGAFATYTPNPGFIGSDSFRYTASDCLGPPGVYYEAPPAAVEACPAGMTIFGSYIPAATVTISVDPAPPTTSTTATSEESTPKYTG